MGTILGIDPGYRKCGISVTVDGVPLCWEVLSLPTKASRAARRMMLIKRLRTLGIAIDLVVIEKLWNQPGVSISTAIIDYAFVANLPIKSINPRSWKKMLLDDGNAPKEASIKYAREKTGDQSLKDDNGADAVCIAICAHEHPQLLGKAE